MVSRNEYLTAHQAFSKMSVSDSWALYFYELDNSPRPIASMVPGQAGCKLLSGPHHIWPEAAGEDMELDDWDDLDPKPEGDEDSEGEEDEAAGDDADPLFALLDEVAIVMDDAGGDPIAELSAALGGEGGAAGDMGGEVFEGGDAPPLAGEVGAAGSAAPADEGVVVVEPKARAPAAEVSVVVPGGKLNFYVHDGRFTAECDNPFHGKCVCTRFLGKRSKFKGMPLGFLKAWLELGPLADSKKLHWDGMQELEASHDLRNSARNRLVAMPEAAALLAREKEPFGAEPLNP